MKRREFLSLCGVAGAAALWPRWSWAADLPRDVKTTRIVGFDLVSKRPKLVGKNSRLGVHGDSATDRMVRLYTNSGLEGLGLCRSKEAALSSLLGKNPFDYYQREAREMRSPLDTGSMPLWDLAGKALNKPVYNLLGGKANRPLPAYDGSIYFADLLPEHVARWEDRFKEEIDDGLRRGHRAFKIKVGRGAKWMPAEEGFERDKAVLRAIRRHAGPAIALGVDANNGYDLARAKRLLSELPDINLAFAEELFPEVLAENLEFKSFLKDHQLQTLVADGETQQSLEPLKPFMEKRAIDVFQGDMNHFGIEGILREASWAESFGLKVGPHNWGSLIGFYQMLHIGVAIPNFYRAENDPLSTDILVAEGYTVKDGLASVPTTPGFGLAINETLFTTKVKPVFDLKA